MVTGCLHFSKTACPAKAVNQFHVDNRVTGDLEQAGIGIDHREASGSADGDVEAVAAVEKLDAAREFVAA